MSSASEFGRDHGLIHEVVVTGRKAGWTAKEWAKLAHDENLMGRLREVFIGEADIRRKDYARDVFPEYPFVGIPRGAKLARKLRFYVARRFGQLSNEYIERIIALNWLEFKGEMLSGPLASLESVQVEVFQGLVELHGGLPDQAGAFLILNLRGGVLGDVREALGINNPPNSKKKYNILPPMDGLRKWDEGLYRRSRTLYRYVTTEDPFHSPYLQDWYQHISKKALPDEKPWDGHEQLQKELAW